MIARTTSDSAVVTHALQQLPELDGLRGIAILMVLLFHFRGDAPVWLSPLLAYGWSGVDLFFVLSGFLITSILLNTKGSPQYFTSFYARRILRILPLYFLAVALFFYVELPMMHARGAWVGITRAEQVWYWSYLMNWRDAAGHMLEPVIHFWSLGVEEQFYVFWPLAIWSCSQKRVPLLCLVTILTSFGLRLVFELSRADPEFLHRATINRLDTLAVGALVAAIMKSEVWGAKLRDNLKVIVPAAIGAFVVVSLGSSQRAFRGAFALSYILIATIFGTLVFHCATRTGDAALLCRFARLKLLRSFGKYSYSVYVFHLLAFRIVRAPAYKFAKDLTGDLSRSIAGPVTLLACVLAAYLFALITWHAFEKHFLKLKDRFPYAVTAADTSLSAAITAD